MSDPSGSKPAESRERKDPGVVPILDAVKLAKYFTEAPNKAWESASVSDVLTLVGAVLKLNEENERLKKSGVDWAESFYGYSEASPAELRDRWIRMEVEIRKLRDDVMSLGDKRRELEHENQLLTDERNALRSRR